MWENEPAAMRSALARHDEILKAAIEQHGGHVFKTVGDAFCAAFPTAPEAVEAALAAQRGLLAEGWEEGREIRVRMALHTGSVEERGGDYFGPPVNRVARLLSAGHGGQTLVSRPTGDLVDGRLPHDVDLRDMGERRLKDLTRSERIFQLVVPDLPEDFAPLKTLDARQSNLPTQPTPLIGREAEVGEVCERLRSPEVRLLTLTGPGGTGKTRLSLQAAADLLDEFEAGAFFVALDAVRDPALAAPTIARSLGITEGGGQPLVEDLKDYLRGKELLLVLDNFEQVLEAAPLVGELLASCPRLRVLVTSRAALGVYGEQEYTVPPLSVPDPERLPPVDDFPQYEAVRLFVERARAVKPDFSLTDANAPAVAEICARLDGLPLAVELAAARTRLLPPRGIRDRLGNSLKLLRGGARDLPARQQTLRGAIDWSHGLLEEDERKLFRRLSVFSGSFALEAAEEVCRAEGGLDALEGVESLLGKSLLRRQEKPDGESRLCMLQTIREYALERLEDSGEAEEVRGRHAEYYLALAEEAEWELNGPRQAMWADSLETDHDNFRAALSWSFGGGAAESGPRLANALWWFWYLRGHYGEGRTWLEQTLARDDRVSAVSRAKAFGRAGYLALIQNDFERAEKLSEEGVSLGRDLGEGHATAVSLLTLGYVALFGGDHGRAEALFRETLAVFGRLGSSRDVGWGLFGLGTLERYRGDHERAMTIFEEALALFEEAGDLELRAATIFNLGDISMLQGDHGRAKEIFEEDLTSSRGSGNKQGIMVSSSNLALIALFEGDHGLATELLRDGLALSRELGHKLDVVNCLEALAGAAGASGEDARAAHLWGAAEALREAIGSPPSSADRALVEPYLAEARSRTDEAAWLEAWTEGRSMAYEEAVSYALEGPVESVQPRVNQDTKREKT